ncbi:hypothetical protein MKEN_00349700 [Mycena kentingensis (nom. inval.)]|nr:hypothetical protein MKEN_00349700 [Mycena kentingensis (nom. inval.)]
MFSSTLSCPEKTPSGDSIPRWSSGSQHNGGSKFGVDSGRHAASYSLFIRSSKSSANLPTMFAKLALSLIAVSALATSAFAAAIPNARGVDYSPSSVEVVSAGHGRRVSFNNYNNIGWTSHFDDFYGIDDFNGRVRHQTVLTSESELVCHSQQVVIIQQRLAVLQEMARRVVTELSCEVETQVLVFEQYFQSLGHFHRDLRRHSGFQVGYDREIVGHFNKFFDSEGALSFDDWGFSGRDIGAHTVVVGKSNWVEPSSRISVDDAYFSAKNAYLINSFA